MSGKCMYLCSLDAPATRNNRTALAENRRTYFHHYPASYTSRLSIRYTPLLTKLSTIHWVKCLDLVWAQGAKVRGRDLLQGPCTKGPDWRSLVGLWYNVIVLQLQFMLVAVFKFTPSNFMAFNLKRKRYELTTSRKVLLNKISVKDLLILNSRCAKVKTKSCPMPQVLIKAQMMRWTTARISTMSLVMTRWRTWNGLEQGLMFLQQAKNPSRESVNPPSLRRVRSYELSKTLRTSSNPILSNSRCV